MEALKEKLTLGKILSFIKREYKFLTLVILLLIQIIVSICLVAEIDILQDYVYDVEKALDKSKW